MSDKFIYSKKNLSGFLKIYIIALIKFYINFIIN
jgi:hypothetical protein